MGIDAEPARPAVPRESVWRKCRRLITPAPFIATCTISLSSAMDVYLIVSRGTVRDPRVFSTATIRKPHDFNAG
jgi:hypothetical protein